MVLSILSGHNCVKQDLSLKCSRFSVPILGGVFILLNLFRAHCESWCLFPGTRVGADQVHQQKQGLARLLFYISISSSNDSLFDVRHLECPSTSNIKAAWSSDVNQFVDIEFHFVSGSPASDGGRQIRKAHGISDTMWQMYRPLAYRCCKCWVWITTDLII